MKLQFNKLFYGSAVASALFMSSCVSKPKVEVAVDKGETPAVEAKGYEFPTTDTTWKTLSLREKIGQTMILVSNRYTHEKAFDGDLSKFVEKYPIGGLFMADWHFKDYGDKSIPYEVKLRKAMEDYQAASKYPLFFTEDFERGLGLTYKDYTHMPAEMSLGAANEPKLAYDYGKSISTEAKTLGINWLLHPVADLNMNPLHPLVIERSISDNPDIALPLLKEQIKGIHDQSVVSTVKHFPGDGATIRDQHLITSENTLSWDEWNKTFGKVFQGLIDDGAPSIMVGHLRFPAFQKDSSKGYLLPATLSSEIIQDLLKEKMKFKGVVMSDALNMGGSAGYYANEIETSVASFAAGVDIVLWPKPAYMDTVEARILRGEIPMSRLDDAVQRVWSIREKFGLLQKPDTIFSTYSDEQRAFVAKTGQAVADKAMTLVRNKIGAIPVTPKDTNILMINISYTDKTDKFETAKKLFEDRGHKVELWYGASFYDWGWRVDYFEKYDKIIICFENRYFDPLGTSYFKNHEALSMWMVNMMNQENVIGVSFSNPYYVSFYMDRCPSLINAYSSDSFSQEALVKAITGEIPFRGKSPVELTDDVLN